MTHYDQRPRWIIEAVTQQGHGYRRYIIGAREDDLNKFTSKLQLSLQQPIPEPDETKIARSIINIDTKEFRNNGIKDDVIKIATQKKSSEQSKKTYSLMASQNTIFSGQNINVGASFFNVGAFDVSALGSALSIEEESSVSLSQEFGIEAELVVPPKTFTEVRITTFAVSYTTKALIRARLPTNAFLMVLAPKRHYCAFLCNKFVKIKAHEFLRLYTGADQVLLDESGHFYYADYLTDLKYLGEVTKIDKQRELPIEN